MAAWEWLRELPPQRIAVLAGGFLLLITKAADIITTALRITHHDQEKNPWARRLMKRHGIGAGIAAVGVMFLITWFLLMAVVWLTDIPVVSYLFLAGALTVSAVQAGVAYGNYTGRPNIFTRAMLRLFALFR